jgi:hypothetical protein
VNAVVRYALYFVPDGVWGDFGARWLGWDVRTGAEIPAADAEQGTLTERPRQYGFHATIKPPFRLTEETTDADLGDEAARFCAGCAPVALNSLRLARIGRFLALTAPGEADDLSDLAARAVRSLDPFRAAPTKAEIARRRQARLTPTQDVLLLRWGYPYVMDEFRFHLTLTGPAPDPDAAEARLEAELAGLEGPSLTLDALSLVEQRDGGRFRETARFRLGH